MTDTDISQLRTMLARIETRMEALEGTVTTEHTAGADRGRDQVRIGERVATLEATVTHLSRAVDALNSRAALAAGGGLGSLGGILWLIFGGTTP